MQSCRKLFYDKGYHETSYDDICNAAHVNRGSIYYHFKEKENIRYEVLWGMHKECQDIAAKYCDRQEHVFKIGSYILWGKTLVDEKLRKFELDYYNDYPVYTPNNPVALYYKMCNQNMFSELGELKKSNRWLLLPCMEIFTACFVLWMRIRIDFPWMRSLRMW